jgi:Suppressor of fused protein (SUFU)
VTDVTAEVRAHLRNHFAGAGISAEPDVATVTFVGVPPVEVLRFGPDPDGVIHYVSVGGSCHAGAGDPTEVVVSLRGPSVGVGLARSVAVLAAAPAVEGLMPVPDALVDLGQPVWKTAPFTAFLLGDSEIESFAGVRFLQAIPVTPNEAAWVRLKGADAMRKAWQEDGVDVLDPARRASAPG